MTTSGFSVPVNSPALPDSTSASSSSALTSFFFIEQPEYEPGLLLGKGMDTARAAATLDALLPALAGVERWEHDALLPALDAFVLDQGFVRTKGDGSQVPDRGPVFMLVRVAVSGRKETPGLPEMLDVLGRERTHKRLATARERLKCLPVEA